jgi:hypothetical protein
MLYTRIAPTIDTPGGELAVLAIASVAKADEGRDGISYLVTAMRCGVETPSLRLTPRKSSGAPAHVIFRKRSGRRGRPSLAEARTLCPVSEARRADATNRHGPDIGD